MIEDSLKALKLEPTVYIKETESYWPLKEERWIFSKAHFPLVSVHLRRELLWVWYFSSRMEWSEEFIYSLKELNLELVRVWDTLGGEMPKIKMQRPNVT